MKVLCIGGSLDGQWREPVFGDILETPIPQTLGTLDFNDVDLDSCPAFGREIYRISRFRSGQKEYLVFKLTTLSENELFERLLANYQPKLSYQNPTVPNLK